MFDLIKRALYPAFGAAVLFWYFLTVQRGVEPFEAENEAHVIAGVSGRSYGGGAHYRSPSVFRFGGLGGK
jgi:hypothetical protein